LLDNVFCGFFLRGVRGMTQRGYRTVIPATFAAVAAIIAAQAARAQSAPAPGTTAQAPTVETPVVATQGPPADKPADPPSGTGKSKFRTTFFDDTDGKFDFSKFLSKGGFIPMPVIVTEPAVGGGFGIMAQFIKPPSDESSDMTRRMLAAVKTGNGSYVYGYFQSGSVADGLITYKFGVGRGKITLDAHPEFTSDPLRYTNHYDYGFLASARIRLPDRRFSVGPIFDFRKLRSQIDFEDPPVQLPDDFNRTLRTGALGAGFHFDSRDNPLSPTEGVNAYVDAKFNDGAFGSDRIYQTYDVQFYGFHTFSDDWRFGVKVTGSAARGDYPLYFAPAINLRGVEAQYYQGATTFNTEAEIVRQLSSRWSVLAFGGTGLSDAGDRRLFNNSGAIVAGGVGFRYRIARKLGLDAGVDVAYGPNGTIFYLQFGHAWDFGMD
jgi:hypothetical protein